MVGSPGVEAPFGRPTGAELLEAAAESLDQLATTGEDAVRRQLLVVAHVIRLVRRELELGHELAAAHRDRLASLGVADDQELADLARSAAPSLLERLGAALREETIGRLRIANPAWLEPRPYPNVEHIFGEIAEPETPAAP